MFSRIDFSQLKARLKDLGQRIIFPPAAADPEARDEAEFMPSRIAALMQNPPRPAFLIIRGTLALFVVGIIWAALAELEEVTVGEGKVIPPLSYDTVVPKFA